MKVSVYIATSLDGYIAREDGDLDWLMSAGNPDDPEDYGYARFMESVDSMIMGRKTFDKVVTFQSWPYEGKEVFILSRTLDSLPEGYRDRARVTRESPEALVQKLNVSGRKRVYVDGGATISAFLEAGLITDLTITRIPVLLGRGIPIFQRSSKTTTLKLVESQAYESGFVQSCYHTA